MATWLCLVAGTVLRIPAQVLYWTSGGATAGWLGASGDLQLLALVLFAINLWRTLDSSAHDQAGAAARPVVVGMGGLSRS